MMRKETGVLAMIAAVPLLAALLYTGPATAPAQAAEGAPDGKEVFLAQKCNMCHAVSAAAIEATTKSEKMKGPDLTGVVAEKGVDWTTKFLHKEVDLDGKKHGKEVKLAEPELKALLSWLEQQQKK